MPHCLISPHQSLSPFTTPRFQPWRATDKSLSCLTTPAHFNPYQPTHIQNQTAHPTNPVTSSTGTSTRLANPTHAAVNVSAHRTPATSAVASENSRTLTICNVNRAIGNPEQRMWASRKDATRGLVWAKDLTRAVIAVLRAGEM